MLQSVTYTDAPISQQFGLHPEWYLRYGLAAHNGLDLAVPTGTTVHAPVDGEIVELAYDPTGYGLYVKVGAMETSWLVAHLSDTGSTRVGDQVIMGTPIGVSGSTGNSTGPHIHVGYRPFERYRVTPYNGYTDPEPVLALIWGRQ